MKIQVENVTKAYATVTAVAEVSLTAEAGQILALLGPNGAGKSSLVRMIVGLTHPDSGQINCLDENGKTTKLAASQFGYLPEDRGLYQDRTLVDNLHYIARLRGMPKTAATQSIDRWLERFALTERADEPMRQLSKGNQQKVQLIATLLHDPRVVILDEPFSGLDPLNQEFVLGVLRELRDAGVTVLLSAHQMALVERLADKLVLMNLGRVVAQGSLAEVQRQLRTSQQVRVEFSQAVDTRELRGLPSVIECEAINPRQLILTCSEKGAEDTLLPELMKLAPVREFRRENTSLHDLYLHAVQLKGESS